MLVYASYLTVERGQHQKRTVASRETYLHDLHTIIEQQQTGVIRGTLGDVFDKFHQLMACACEA
ncbi:hypothetical protein AF72_10645 [Xylella taiwanensis]|uniref:Uncharacterized protein n=1 Tax=Xylella taiwanensis TaxID=1444770 RepID=Z9JIA4_9GAMM|nr:hypothetical protein AF72_10645 [Xylella taiwanensis]